MKEIALTVKKRETGKRASKDVRVEGLVPGIYYAKGDENINIKVHPIALRPIVYTSQTRVVELSVEGSTATYPCILKDVSFDPVTDKITHFDLQGIKPGEKLTVDLPFKFVGVPAGVRTGGKLMTMLHKVKVKCLPGDLIESLEIDITKLVMGDHLALKDLDFGNMEVEIPLNTVILQVVKPRGGAQ
jgi:large subunit ribosomal protein L25